MRSNTQKLIVATTFLLALFIPQVLPVANVISQSQAGIAIAAPERPPGRVQATDELDGERWRNFQIQDELMPEVGMAAGALVTADGRFLWSRYLDEQRPPASLTKIMTAILIIENLDEDEEITLPAMPIGIYESRAFLRPGEILTRQQLLQALLIVSGNDAARAAAEVIAGDLASFVAMMNERAAELGMTNTQFMTASGIDADGQFSTARDIATMTRFAMEIPE
ncbi:MAG: hypothetical protein FWC81_03855, partial [Coriobacteriia bacterium]|nr:hypothetical protein [Coriobacteriia bacterium]